MTKNTRTIGYPVGMVIRSVACAWCEVELRVLAPELGSEDYYSLPRVCHQCSGHNIVEVVGTLARAFKRRARRAATTRKLRVAALRG
jgi:hypothetical protein